MWTDHQRQQRRHNAARKDQRSPFQRDRDRILYSSAFRRLAGITQIVRAGEADVFHTRQQHTLKVAQVGRRISDRLLLQQPAEASSLGLDVEVVEAACLAHDLGHPPFGHVGEHVLGSLASKNDADGFEGNAQTFRIVTRLAVRFDSAEGLDLTRATLAACLKYPWIRDVSNPARTKKWGAYEDDRDDFTFARMFSPGENKTLEAEIMDWADDIAYSVHDLEDFHRCGVIPWHQLFSGDAGRSGTPAASTIDRATQGWYNSPVDAIGRLRDAFRNLEDLLRNTFEPLLFSPYEGTREQRQMLRTMTSSLIARYIGAASLSTVEDVGNGLRALQIGDQEQDEIRILKQITRDYIIENPSLVAQQKGQQRVLSELFETILGDATSGHPRYLPPRLRYLWRDDLPRARFVADAIASLTEAEALGLHSRLHGRASGSVLDPIVR